MSEAEFDTGLFWAGAPLTVRSDLFHIFDEETERSLCGRYDHVRANEKAPVKEGQSWTDGKDCKSCCRKADPVEVEDD